MWKLIENNGEYIAVHKCISDAYSWKEGPQWTATGRFDGKCMECKMPPPEAMQGFITLLQWER